MSDYESEYTNRVLGELTDEVYSLKKELAKTNRSADLTHAAVDRGGIDFMNASGQVGMHIGADSRGVVTTTYHAGPDPWAPSTPVITAGVGNLSVSWDGFTEHGTPPEANFRLLRIYASLEADFTPDVDTYQGDITSIEGGSKTLTLPYGTWYIRTVIITVSGQRSQASAAVEAEILPTAAQEDMVEALGVLDEKLADAATDLEGHRGRIEEVADYFANSPRVLHGVGEPGEDAPDGSTYYQHADQTSGQIIGQWTRVEGNWVSTPLDASALEFSESITELVLSNQEAVKDALIVNGELWAQAGRLINLDVGNLVATDATIDEAVIMRLFADIFTANKITARELSVQDIDALGRISADVFQGREFFGGTFTGGLFQSDSAPDTGMKLNSTGLSFWEVTEQAEGEVTASPSLQVGVDGQAGLSSISPEDGQTRWQITSEGDSTLNTLSVNEDPLIMGYPLLGSLATLSSSAIEDVGDGSWLSQLPRGVVAWHSRDASGFRESVGQERAWVELQFTMEPGRAYRVSMDPITVHSPGGRRINAIFRHRNNAACALNSQILSQFATEPTSVDVGQLSGSHVFSHSMDMPVVQKYIMMSISSDQPWTISSPSPLGLINLVVEDLGLAVTGGHNRNITTSTPTEGGGGSPDPSTSRTYDSTWQPDWMRSWHNGGRSIQSSGLGSRVIKQGRDPYWTGGGLQTGMWGYTSGADIGDNRGQAISTAMNGADLISASLWLTVNNAYSSPATLRLHWHSNSSAPSEYHDHASANNWIADIHVRSGGSKGIPLPKAVRDAIKSGSLRGFSVNARGSTSRSNAIGISFGSSPSLRLRYKK